MIFTDDETVNPPEGAEVHRASEEVMVIKRSDAPYMVLTHHFAAITGKEFEPGWYYLKGSYDEDGTADFDDDGPVNGPYVDRYEALQAAGLGQVNN